MANLPDLTEKLAVKRVPISDNLSDLNFVDYLSVLSAPAIMVDGKAYSDLNFGDTFSKLSKVTDETKCILTGPLMIPDLPILRGGQDGNPFEFHTFFRSDI